MRAPAHCPSDQKRMHRGQIVSLVQVSRQVDQHPFDRVVDALRARGCLYGHGCTQHRNKVRVVCPLHRDVRPSLVVTRIDAPAQLAILKCFAGCSTPDLVTALGLTMRDLGRVRTSDQRWGRIVATYDYVSMEGEFLAQKCRFDPKSFRWRMPDPIAKDGWRWSLRNGLPGLYRLADIAGAGQVVMVEGEKAVELLWTNQVPTVCPPAGSSTWLPVWTEALWAAGCRELTILPDNDPSGIRHAERVATSCYTRGLHVKVVTLPGLPRGGDVNDWLRGDRAVNDLAIAISAAAWWFPGVVEQRRAERRRKLTRERVRKYRCRKNGNAVKAEAV